VSTNQWRWELMKLSEDGIWEDTDLLALPSDQQDKVCEILERAARELCDVTGHAPERDQCGIPEHDFCMWCQTRLPGAAGDRS
jgi:hypothetical protein